MELKRTLVRTCIGLIVMAMVLPAIAQDISPSKESLKNVYFDYIRAGFRAAHNIRDIGNPSKGQGFFSKKSVWDDFLSRYESNVEPVSDEEKIFEEWRSDLPDTKLTDIIKARIANRVSESTSNSTSLPKSRKYSATTVAVSTACTRATAG